MFLALTRLSQSSLLGHQSRGMIGALTSPCGNARPWFFFRRCTHSHGLTNDRRKLNCRRKNAPSRDNLCRPAFRRPTVMNCPCLADKARPTQQPAWTPLNGTHLSMCQLTKGLNLKNQSLAARVCRLRQECRQADHRYCWLVFLAD